MGYRVIFDYGAMEDAADWAKKTASRLEDYQDELEKKVCKKLREYDGDSCGWLSEAKSAARRKKTALGDKEDALKAYADDLLEMEKACRKTDSDVQNKIHQLCGDFTTTHGITITQKEYNRALKNISRANGNVVSRYLDDWADDVGANLGTGLNKLGFWYQYDGGKYVVWENLKAALAIAVAVVSVVVAVITFPVSGPLAIAAAVASIVVGVVSIIDGVTDIVNNCRAASAAANDDPARAKRLNEVNGVTDQMRLSYSKGWHIAAGVTDAVVLVAKVVQMVKGIKDLVSKGYKWITNAKYEVKDFKWSKMKWGDFKNGATAKLNNFKDDAINAFGKVKAGQWDWVKTQAITTGKEWWKNFTATYKKGWNNMHLKDDNGAKIAFDAMTKEQKGDYFKAIKTFISAGKDVTKIFDGNAADTLITNALTGIAFNGDVTDPEDKNVFTLDLLKSNCEKLHKNGESGVELLQRLQTSDAVKPMKAAYRAAGASR